MRTRWLIAGVLIVTGLIFIGQGTGLIPGRSTMTNDIRWAVIGATLTIVGVVIVVGGISRRPTV